MLKESLKNKDTINEEKLWGYLERNWTFDWERSSNMKHLKKTYIYNIIEELSQSLQR